MDFYFNNGTKYQRSASIHVSLDSDKKTVKFVVDLDELPYVS
jgi:hypothetical protein